MTINQASARGFVLCGIAAFFLVQAAGLSLGTLSHPGAGLFPSIVGGLLLLVAVAILVQSRIVASPPLVLQGRNIGLVSLSLVSFVLVTEYVNMLAAIVTLVVVSSFAAAEQSWRRTAIIAAALCAVAIVMKKALGVQLPLL